MTPLDTAATGVGASLPRLDAREKVTGRAQYIADMVRPDMLHAAIHASPVAHAIIKGYDIGEALAVPGVACVLTGEDFPDGRMGAFIKDEHAIAKGKVRYPGEPVAVVAAEDEETARRAAALIRVDYEELPVAATPEEAMAPDAPLIHEGLADYFKVFPAICGGNIASENRTVRRRCRQRLGGLRRHRRRRLRNAGPGASLHRAGRRSCRSRSGRPGHPVVGQPVGVPRPGQCLREPAIADVEAALPHAQGRRRLRQQDGAPCPAARCAAGAQDRPAGEADPQPDRGFRDGARAPSVQNPLQDRGEE